MLLSLLVVSDYSKNYDLKWHRVYAEACESLLGSFVFAKCRCPTEKLAPKRKIDPFSERNICFHDQKPFISAVRSFRFSDQQVAIDR